MHELLINNPNKIQQNAKEVYGFIRAQEPVSRAELEIITGYKPTTLVRTLSYLMEARLIHGSDVGESTGGRKPALYRINPAAGYIVGVDISRTYCKVALMDLECKVLRSSTFGMYAENTQTATLGRVCSLIGELSSGVDRRSILGIGVGTVGPLKRETGIIRSPGRFPTSDWENGYIKKELERVTGLLTLVENGASAAAFGEYKKGSAKNYNSIAYIISGAGLRLGTISNGKIARNNIINENGIGHVVVDIFGETCSCGNKGCLEAYTAIPAIMKSFINELKQGKYSIALEKVDFDLKAINIDVFCEAVKKGDKLALEVVEKATAYFAVGLSNLINILNPELIILGGPLIKKCELFYKMTTSIVEERIRGTLPYVPNFSMGELEEEAVVVGCGNIILDYLEI